MKNLILGALVATTMLSGTAFASDNVCKTTADISAMPYQNVFNKTVLTAKDKCWLDVHATKSHGIDGSVFWVKIGGKYYSTHISQLREKSDRLEWFDSIKAEVVGSYEAVETSSNDYAAATVMVEDAETKADLVEALEAKMVAETKLTEALETIGAQTEEIESLMAEIAENATEITELNSMITDLKSDIATLKATEYELTSNDKALQDKIQSIVDGYKVRSAQLGVPAVGGWFNMKDFNSTEKGLRELEFTLTTLTTNFSVWYKLANKYLAKVNDIKTNKDNPNYTTYKAGNGVSDNTGTAVDVSGGEVAINDSTMSFASTTTVNNIILAVSSNWNSIENDLNKVLEEAYDTGYADGYQDGYADGFKDGVDSVTK